MIRNTQSLATAIRDTAISVDDVELALLNQPIATDGVMADGWTFVCPPNDMVSVEVTVSSRVGPVVFSLEIEATPVVNEAEQRDFIIQRIMTTVWHSALPITSSQPKAIGDPTCANNARSPYLRCAVNPCGPCEDCKFYE